MSKTIKLEEKTYHQLDQLRGKRDTFSDIVAKLLATKEGVDTIVGIWQGRPGEVAPGLYQGKESQRIKEGRTKGYDYFGHSLPGETGEGN